MDAADQAVSDFAAGYSCSQSVLRAFAARFGMEPEEACRLASAFGGGMGRSGRTCGAVTGALMALGLRYGFTDPQDKATKEQVYILAQEFLAAFEAKHGSTDCPGLLGCHIGTADGAQQARDQNVFKLKCPDFVHDAAAFAAELIER